MVIDKTILMALSLSNRVCPYEFNASIDCWLKTTSHDDVIAPSTVSNTQNAKLLTSRNLCHSLMLCHVTRSQRKGDCETLRRPTRISRARLRRNRRSCRKWITRDYTEWRRAALTRVTKSWSHMPGKSQMDVTIKFDVNPLSGLSNQMRENDSKSTWAVWSCLGSSIINISTNFEINRLSERERDIFSLSAFLRTEDIRVHIVHISRLIITYTLE